MAEEAPAAASTPSAPAPAAPAPSEAPASSPQSESFDNLGSYDDLDSVEVSADSVAPPPGASVAETAEAESPPVPPASPPQQPPPAEAKPVQEPPKAAAPPTPEPAGPDNSPQGLVTQLEHHRGAVLQALAADRFKLSPEEVSAIDTDAVGAIPHIMARVYYEAMQSTLLHIQNMVPQVVGNMMKAQKASDEVETAFYGQFKAIDRAKHQNDVMQFAKLLRASNPQISQADLFATVGAAVMAKHQLQTPPAVNGNGAVPRQAQPAPFRPATAGATVRVIPETESPFAGLGKDWDE